VKTIAVQYAPDGVVQIPVVAHAEQTMQETLGEEFWRSECPARRYSNNRKNGM
jgi:hypothetical protein